MAEQRRKQANPLDFGTQRILNQRATKSDLNTLSDQLFAMQPIVIASIGLLLFCFATSSQSVYGMRVLARCGLASGVLAFLFSFYCLIKYGADAIGHAGLAMTIATYIFVIFISYWIV